MAVGVRDPDRSRGLDLPASVEVSADLDALVARPDLDVVVELLGGLEPAERLVWAALEHSHAVVTANKALIAARGASLEQLSRRTGAPLRFEAAVGGGTPILGPLVRDLAATHIRSVAGIVNGTTNHILTAMTRHGTDYPNALAEAQRLGYAEADPTADVTGADAASKLAILTRLAFGVWLDPEAMPRSQPPGEVPLGIGGVTSQAIAAAAEQEMAIKLLAHAERATEGAVSAWVAPVAVPRRSPIGSTDGVTNIIEIDTDLLGRMWLRGPGAGGSATSSAVLADLLALGRGEGSTWSALPEAPTAANSASGWAGAWLDVETIAGRSRYPVLD